MEWDTRTSESKCYNNSRGTIEGRDGVPAPMPLVEKMSLGPRKPRLLLCCQPVRLPSCGDQHHSLPVCTNAVPNQPA